MVSKKTSKCNMLNTVKFLSQCESPSPAMYSKLLIINNLHRDWPRVSGYFCVVLHWRITPVTRIQARSRAFFPIEPQRSMRDARRGLVSAQLDLHVAGGQIVLTYGPGLRSASLYTPHWSAA